MASTEGSTATPEDQPIGQSNGIPAAPLLFPDPDASPIEFLVYLKSLSINDLASSWEHLNLHPGRTPPLNLYDEASAESWTDRMDIFLVSTTHCLLYI